MMTDEVPDELNQSTTGTATKKSVHVKWAGKTIALGTFPPEEADDKCARAKALTRSWRSTMRPKPTREWVMLELERLQIRVVSGRLGRKAERTGNNSDVDNSSDDEEKKMEPSKMMSSLGMGGGLSDSGDNLFNSNVDDLLSLSLKNDQLGMGSSNATNSLNTIADAALLEQALNIGSSSDLSHNTNLSGDSTSGYDATRPGSSSILPQQQLDMDSSGNNASSNNNWLSLTQGMGLQSYNSVGNALLNCDNPSQHYEMLKLHHMNLLNEIKETTLLMNLFKKHRLQKSALENPSGTPLLDLLRGTPRPSLQEQLQQIQQQQAQQQQQNILNIGMGSSGAGSAQMENFLRQYSAPSDNAQTSSMGNQLDSSKSKDQEIVVGDHKLMKIKEEIAALQRKAQELESRTGSGDSGKDSSSGKRKR